MHSLCLRGVARPALSLVSVRVTWSGREFAAFTNGVRVPFLLSYPSIKEEKAAVSVKAKIFDRMQRTTPEL